jgi:hypothetical protein
VSSLRTIIDSRRQLVEVMEYMRRLLASIEAAGRSTPASVKKFSDQIENLEKVSESMGIVAQIIEAQQAEIASLQALPALDSADQAAIAAAQANPQLAPFLAAAQAPAATATSATSGTSAATTTGSAATP